MLVTVLVCMVALAAAHPHPEWPEHNEPALPPAGTIIGGSGNYTFKYRADLLQLPSSVKVRNAHGLCKDKQGNIYLTYESTSVDSTTRALAKFSPDGTSVQLLGKDNTLAIGTPHGLRISFEADGDFLYHANNNQLLHKTDLEGNIVWTTNLTEPWGGKPEFFPIKPTDAMVPPGSQYVYLSDGYGSSYVHKFNIKDGKYSGQSFGGPGKATSPTQQFHCPHGINYDPRSDRVLVSDRGNNRLQYTDRNGTHLATVEMAAGSPLAVAGTQPCNVDFKEDIALTPGLDGPVGILDKTMTTALSVIEAGKLLGKACPHPHDGIFLDNGDVVVCCWNPGFVSYWQKM